MFAQRKKSNSKLENLIIRYMELICNKKNVRLLVPSQEVWRFFVDGDIQEKGKNLSRFFDKRAWHYTIKQYAELVEKGSGVDWREGRIMNLLAGWGWNFSIEECEQLTINDFLSMDKGWLQYENELGYIKGLYTAYQAIFDFHIELNIAFIKNLHKLAAKDVKNTLYDMFRRPDAIGEFRSSDVAFFPLIPEHSTSHGLTDILNRSASNPFSSLCLALEDPAKNKDLGMIKITEESVKTLRSVIDKLCDQNYVELEELVAIMEPHLIVQDKMHFVIQMRGNPAFLDVLTKIAEAENNKKIAEVLFGFIKNLPFEDFNLLLTSYQPQQALHILNEEMKNLILKYDLAINAAETPTDRLRAIITFIQSSHHLHPFADGNGRTFCILLFNHLLMRDGFPPTIFPNISQFNALSVDQLVKKTLKGMEDTLDLAEGKHIHNITTNEVFITLKANKHLAKYADYFEMAVAIEEAGRESIQLKRMKFD